MLQIGVLLPSSGAGAAIGQSARAAIRVAVDLANQNGGVNGHPVQTYFRDEGADAVTASIGLDQLLANQVDVIIGPGSSNTTVALLPKIVQAGVAACSPSASALELDTFPDRGLFFRTIPSDSLQAEAIAKVIEQTGDTSAAVGFVNDAYGRPFELAVEHALRARGIAVSDSVGYAVDDDEFSTEATRLAKAGNGAIALIGDPDAGFRMLAALAEATKASPRDIVLNDAMRKPWSLSLVASVSKDARHRIIGVSQSVQTSDKTLLAALTSKDPGATGLFASQAYDCANLFMLAAQRSGSTQPDQLAALVPDISAGGSVCATFVQCADLLKQGRNVDYEGPTGVLVLGKSGDPSAGEFEEFNFDDTGRDVLVQDITVTGNQ